MKQINSFRGQSEVLKLAESGHDIFLNVQNGTRSIKYMLSDEWCSRMKTKNNKTFYVDLLNNSQSIIINLLFRLLITTIWRRLTDLVAALGKSRGKREFAKTEYRNGIKKHCESLYFSFMSLVELANHT